jgi:methylmalonyl-CoA/ethylmalonyl-CoA epimerase
MSFDPASALSGLSAGTAGHLDHIGIAVADLEQGLALYRDLLGLELERIEEVPQENVRVAFLKLDRQGGPGHLELLAPMSDQGAIAAFIAKRGPGLHHVAIAATDVAAVLERCRAEGLQLLDEVPRPGAGGKLIAFVHPRATGGVLLEICGPAPAGNPA